MGNWPCPFTCHILTSHRARLWTQKLYLPLLMIALEPHKLIISLQSRGQGETGGKAQTEINRPGTQISPTTKSHMSLEGHFLSWSLCFPICKALGLTIANFPFGIWQLNLQHFWEQMLRVIRVDLFTDKGAPKNQLSGETTEGKEPRGPEWQ